MCMLVLVRHSILHCNSRACNGLLTQLTYAVLPLERTMPGTEFFNIWREDASNPGLYNLVLPSQSREKEQLNMSINTSRAIYSIDLGTPWEVQPNDILGYTLTTRSSSLLLSSGVKNQRTSFFLRNPAEVWPPESVRISSVGGMSSQPLITAVVSCKQPNS